MREKKQQNKTVPTVRPSETSAFTPGVGPGRDAGNGRETLVSTTAALVGVGVGAAVWAGWRQWRPADQTATIPSLELTPGYRGGAGSPLLLLHGVSGIWRAWSPVLPYLEDRHDVLAPTLLGHGGASVLDPRVPPSIGALADGIEDHLDRAGVGALHIVGNSLGGWIAIELARRGRALSLVLFSPGGAWRSQRRIEATATALRVSIDGVARVAGHADVIASRAVLRWLLLSTQVAHPGRVRPEWVSASIRAAALAPVVDELLRTLPRQQVESIPAGQTYPIRLVWPEHDRVLPFAHFGAPMLERIPDAELVRLAGVGHVPMSDDPATVARLILEVTSAVDAAAASEYKR
jgi:pimeloyl-ACP methyl ester carboxylesterase